MNTQQETLKKILSHAIQLRSLIGHIDIVMLQSDVTYTYIQPITKLGLQQSHAPNRKLATIYMMNNRIEILYTGGRTSAGHKDSLTLPQTPTLDTITIYNLSDPQALDKIAKEIERIYMHVPYPLN